MQQEKNNCVVVMRNNGFPASVAREVVGVSQRQLDYWDQCDLVPPTIQVASGKGSERRYSFDDLLRLAVVKKLRDAGLSLQKVREGLKVLRKRWPKKDPLLDELIATDGARFFRISGSRMEDVLTGGQLLLSFVAIGRIRQELSSEVLRLDRSPNGTPQTPSTCRLRHG